MVLIKLKTADITVPCLVALWNGGLKNSVLLVELTVEVEASLSNAGRAGCAGCAMEGAQSPFGSLLVPFGTYV